MATRIVLVQHGEKMREPGDPRLTDVGLRQVAETARWIEGRYGRSFAPVLSSPLRRARETAAPIAHHLGTEVSIDDRLVERMNWSVESGLDLPTFLAEWDRASSDRSYQPAIGESSTATGERMLAALHDVSATHPECTVVVATHGGATVDLLRTLLGDAVIEERVPGLIAEGPEPCAITVLGRDDQGWRVDEIAKTAHIARSRRGWWIDETVYAGAEHLDADYVAAYEQKAGFDPADDIEVFSAMAWTPTRRSSISAPVRACSHWPPPSMRAESSPSMCRRPWSMCCGASSRGS
jgi:broad specificity phosphatase PhoE